jgi:hypothetical protein
MRFRRYGGRRGRLAPRLVRVCVCVCGTRVCACVFVCAATRKRDLLILPSVDMHFAAKLALPQGAPSTHTRAHTHTRTHTHAHTQSHTRTHTHTNASTRTHDPTHI